jgi:hypothetical protein
MRMTHTTEKRYVGRGAISPTGNINYFDCELLPECVKEDHMHKWELHKSQMHKDVQKVVESELVCVVDVYFVTTPNSGMVWVEVCD